ncbi:MAG: response regulator [Anaerolineaceae bacterium]|nr:response regulator [Anaerolineaceae bacterium]
MAVQPTELLFVSDDGDRLTATLNNTTYRIHTIHEPGQAMEALRDNRYELILLVDSVFDSEILSVVKEIKRRVPLVPVLVFSQSTDPAYQTDLMESGADDVLLPEIPGDELERRLRLILRQRRHNQILAQRNQNMQAITVVARRLHSATEPLELIHDTIDLASTTFKLYGLAIILGEGDSYQLYAGREGAAVNSGLYESQIILKDYDPFRRVIQSGIVQIFRNIVADPHYIPIPVLPTPESAIIVPLNYQEHKFGAMAVFGTSQHPLSHDDLLIYELFASQFTLALHNARHYHSQRISAQSSQHLIRAWQRFINLHSFTDIAKNLHELVEDIPNVGNALVWMYDNDIEAPGTLTQGSGDQAVQVFRELEAAGKIDEFIKLLDDNHFQPISLYLGMGKNDPLRGLFSALNGQQLTVVPIVDAARFSGGIIASVTNSRQYSAEDAKLLIVSLAHAAGQALERSTLIARAVEKSNQLETMLRSISEGFFFVDDGGHVVFCNPQFTELTGINPSEVLDKDSDTLLRAIAEQAEDTDWVQSQLKDAIDRVLAGHPQGSDDYPIVEITLTNPDRDLHIEFTHIPGIAGAASAWAGIIRSNTRFKSMFSMQALLLDKMSERIRVPYAQVRGLITTLNEQHSRFTHRERSRFLRQIEESVEDLGRLWDNFLEMYHLEIAGLSLSREEADLYDLVQHVLESRLFGDQRRQVHVESPARLPLVEFDDLRLEQALANVLHNAFKFSSSGAPIHLNIERQGSDEVRIVIRDQGMGIPAEELEKVFEPFYQASNNATEEGAGLGLYLTRQIIRRHGGNIWVESELGKGTTFTLSLPVVAGEAVFVHSPRPVPAPVTPPVPETAPAMPDALPRTPDRVTGGRRVTDRQPQTIMVVGKQSNLLNRLVDQLDDQGYELIPFESGEEALRDVNTVRLDLILLDVNLPDANGLDICERLCKRTEVPIILLADDPSDPEKVRALLLGADDYIDDSVSDDELMARVNVIFKRRRIPDRTREPLDLGNLFVDFARREVYLNNAPLELTRIEYDLLHTLAVNQGQVLTHKQLLEKVWGPEYQGETQYLWVNVSRLRKKLEPTPDSPRYIHTQPGVGYVFRSG